jgi:plasmid stabilization system protein ParE
MILIWSPLALERVVEIGQYIAEDYPGAAANVVEGIFASVRRLDRYPESGRRVPESERKDLREAIHGNYRVIYRVDPDRLVVLTVRHVKAGAPTRRSGPSVEYDSASAARRRIIRRAALLFRSMGIMQIAVAASPPPARPLHHAWNR